MPQQVDGGRDPVRLRRYLEAYALNTAGVVEEKTLLEAAGINRRTAQAYERLLANLLVVESLPAWASNRLKRLVLTPKRHLVDPALAGGVLRLDADTVLRDGDLLGRLLDTFVLAQLRAELPVTAARPRLYHVRQQQGRFEVDLLAELAGGGLVGMEVKATASPGRPMPAISPGCATATRTGSSPAWSCTRDRGPSSSGSGWWPRRSPHCGAGDAAARQRSGRLLPEHRRGCDDCTQLA